MGVLLVRVCVLHLSERHEGLQTHPTTRYFVVMCPSPTAVDELGGHVAFAQYVSVIVVRAVSMVQ